MGRYFPNPFYYQDIERGAHYAIDNTEIIPQINHHVATITKHLQPSLNNVDGGLYVGVTGIALMFYRLSKNSILSENREMYLEKGLEYLQPALEKSAGDKTSFLLGDAGTYAVATVLRKESGKENYMDTLEQYQGLYNQYLDPKFLECGGDELFVGRAGYLAGALWLQRELQTQVLEESALFNICDMMISSGVEYAQKHKSPCPLMYHYYNNEYLGAAHGISFILQMLLSVPGYLKYNKRAARDIKATVDFLLKLQNEDGNWPCSMEELSLPDYRPNEKRVQWCHGAPGTIYLMARAYKVFEDRKYLDACTKAGQLVWGKGILRKGPGICHGVAGNGYVFLMLHRLTENMKYLYRAKVFADYMDNDAFWQHSKLPDNPLSLYEGTAGTVCFLADMLVPDNAEFPFQDVFSY